MYKRSEMDKLRSLKSIPQTGKGDIIKISFGSPTKEARIAAWPIRFRWLRNDKTSEKDWGIPLSGIHSPRYMCRYPAKMGYKYGSTGPNWNYYVRLSHHLFDRNWQERCSETVSDFIDSLCSLDRGLMQSVAEQRLIHGNIKPPSRLYLIISTHPEELVK